MRIVSLIAILGLFVACKPAARQPESELKGARHAFLRVLEAARRSDRLDLVKYLKSLWTDSLSTAFRRAAGDGRLDVVKFLRSEIEKLQP